MGSCPVGRLVLVRTPEVRDVGVSIVTDAVDVRGGQSHSMVCLHQGPEPQEIQGDSGEPQRGSQLCKL